MKTVIVLTEQQQEFLKSQSTQVFDGEVSWYQLPNHWFKPIGDDRYEISETSPSGFESKPTVEEVLTRLTSFQAKTSDKWWLQESIRHYLEHGTISGSFRDAILKAMEEYAILRNQELVDALQKAIGLLTNIRSETDYMPDFYYEWIDKVIDETEEYAISPWIPVAERLPDFGESVLVFCRIYGRYVGQYVFIGEFRGEKYGNWHDGKNLGVLPPTHWMPLPEPPKQ